MEKDAINLYLRALKNTQICVTGRAPLTFTVNGCETLQAYREQLFDEVAAALEYCILLTQDRVANAGKIRMLEVHLKHIRNHIFLDKEDSHPRRPNLYVEEGGRRLLVQDDALREALEDYIGEQLESINLMLEVLRPEQPISDFPFRFTGNRMEFIRFVRALFITDKIVPEGGVKMIHCVRYLMILFHVPEGRNLSNVIYRLVCTDNQLRFFDNFRRDLEKQILAGK